MKLFVCLLPMHAEQGQQNRGLGGYSPPLFTDLKKLKLNHVGWQNLVASNSHTADHDSDCEKKTCIISSLIILIATHIWIAIASKQKSCEH